jgi:hypothetical protein
MCIFEVEEKNGIVQAYSEKQCIIQKDIYKRYLYFIFIYQYFHINGEIRMQYAIIRPHACMLPLLCPCIKRSSLFNEKCMTGQE